VLKTYHTLLKFCGQVLWPTVGTDLPVLFQEEIAGDHWEKGRPQSPGDMLRHNAALKRKATNGNMEPSPLKRKTLQGAGQLYSNMLTPKKASNSTAQLYASMLGEGVSSPKVSASGSDAIVLSSDDDDQVPNASSSSKVAPVPLPTTTSTSEKVPHWYDPAHKDLARHGKICW